MVRRGYSSNSDPAKAVDELKERLEEIDRDVNGLQLMLICECLWRKIEIEQRGALDQVRDILAPYPVLGFNSYGEQFGGIHVNQTLTGLTLGAPRDG